MATILVVEDNKSTQTLTVARLQPRYTVLSANDGEQALDVIYDKAVDLVIADVMMPNMDGLTLLRTLREDGNSVPVLLLTAKDTFEDKREGFTSGTDDYLTKPVNYDELIWHVEALLRRSRISSEHRIELKNTTIDSSSYEVLYNGNPVAIPRKEFDLLFKLLSYPNHIFTKAQLLDDIWGFNSDSSEDTVKTHINRLRNRFSQCKDFEIVTIKGIGYKAEIRQGASV